MIDRLRTSCPLLRLEEICAGCRHSLSQIYQWRQAVSDRKKRKPKVLAEQTVENAAEVIAAYPHFSGRKGQAYMLYHELGFIGMKAYDGIKKNVKRLLCQEASTRQDGPGKEYYEHVRPTGIDEIWAEDFTELRVCGVAFKAALLIDVFSQYLLGVSVAMRATAALVAEPVNQALAFNNGQGPAKFLLSDNGKQYISEEHGRLLDSVEIVQKRIPSCKPQYNGAVECGGKEFKNIFYNIWERREREGSDKEKNLTERVRLAVVETAGILNHEIPRPSLDGVAPVDVQQGREVARKAEVERYREGELAKKDPPPWKRKYWDVLKTGVGTSMMNTKELLTKLAFFFPRPLRRIAQLNQEVWGN